MAQITIEYMILIPLLILQIFLFPLTVGWIMNTWVDSRRSLALEEIANHIGSSIQQIYFSLDHASISAGNLTSKLDVPPSIEGYCYCGNATIRQVLEPELNGSKILDITLNLVGFEISVSATVTLGNNVEWRNSYFLSNSTLASVTGEKFSNETILMHFGI
ncbi:MAG: hypothetical protein N3D85_03720 [Candidatus Bathyarchaeota archaeon]|nr:hypothetical protein [Candidatus Bathyarchaeota archaeon]